MKVKSLMAPSLHLAAKSRRSPEMLPDIPEAKRFCDTAQRQGPWELKSSLDMRLTKSTPIVLM